jgi:ketosteroid isomerase-like protein
MAAEENRRVVNRFFDELWNERRLSAAADLFSPDCVTHQLRSGAADTPAPRPPEIIKAHIDEWLSAFPDIHFAVEQVVAEGNLVAVRCAATGTHTGSWLGIPPTGKHVNIRMALPTGSTLARSPRTGCLSTSSVCSSNSSWWRRPLSSSRTHIRMGRRPRDQTPVKWLNDCGMIRERNRRCSVYLSCSG